MIKVKLNILLFISLFTSLNLFSVNEVVLGISRDSFNSLQDYLENEIHFDLSIDSFDIKKAQVKSIFFDTENQKLYKEYSYIEYSKFNQEGQKKVETISIGQNKVPLIQDTYEVKNYNTIATYDEKNQLLKRIKRDIREQFKSEITKAFNVNPLNYIEFIEINNNTKVYKYILSNGKEIQLFLSKSVIDKYKITHTGYNITLKYNSDNLDEVTNFKNVLLENFSDTVEYSNSYIYAFELIKKKIPLANILVRYPMVYKLIQAFIIVIIGFLIYFILFRKRLFGTKKKENYEK